MVFCLSVPEVYVSNSPSLFIFYVSIRPFCRRENYSHDMEAKEKLLVLHLVLVEAG